MAHTKAGGKTSQKVNRPGPRLGIKIYDGEKIKTGMIIVRQRGTIVRPGDGVEMGRDYTIFSMKDGVVAFKKQKGNLVVSVN